MATKSNIQDLNVDQAVQAQAKQIKGIQEKIDKLIVANQQLKESRDLQNKIDEFKRDNQPTSKFRKMLRIYPTVKHWFVKSTAEKIEGKISQNHQILEEIDKTLVKMGETSSILQEVIKAELNSGVDRLEKKLTQGINSEVPKAIRDDLGKLKISEDQWKKAVGAVYNENEIVELKSQNLRLQDIKSNINRLLDENKNIPKLAPLQKELNTAHDQLKKSFGEHIKDTWGKIKSVFKDTNLQKLQTNALDNNKKLDAIDKDLEKNLKNIKKSVKSRQEKLQKQFDNLYKGLNYDQLNNLQNFQENDIIENAIKALDTRFVEAITQVGKVMDTMPAELVINAGKSPDQPNLRVPSFAPPPTPPSSTALQENLYEEIDNDYQTINNPQTPTQQSIYLEPVKRDTTTSLAKEPIYQNANQETFYSSNRSETPATNELPSEQQHQPPLQDDTVNPLMSKLRKVDSSLINDRPAPNPRIEEQQVNAPQPSNAPPPPPPPIEDLVASQQRQAPSPPMQNNLLREQEISNPTQDNHDKLLKEIQLGIQLKDKNNRKLREKKDPIQNSDVEKMIKIGADKTHKTNPNNNFEQNFDDDNSTSTIKEAGKRLSQAGTTTIASGKNKIQSTNTPTDPNKRKSTLTPVG